MAINKNLTLNFNDYPPIRRFDSKGNFRFAGP